MRIEYLADRPEFVATLAAWHRREWGQFRPDESVEARAAKLRTWSGRRQIPTVLVASVDDTLYGSAMLVAQDMETRPQWSPWLAGVVVAPERRRRGIGAALVERSLTEARNLGYPALYLYTFGTERYYARSGWSVLERTRYLGADVTVMSFELTPGSGPVPAVLSEEPFPPPPGSLAFEDVYLRFVKVVSGEPSRGLVPSYHFRLLLEDGTDVGHLNFRVGDTEHVRLCAGHIGYEVLEPFRGHGYARKACRAVGPFIGLFYDAVMITCDPDNAPSMRTIEHLGAIFLDEVPVSPDDPHYQRGSRWKRRYRWKVRS